MALRSLGCASVDGEADVALRKFGVVLLTAALVAGLGACGDDDDDTEASDATEPAGGDGDFTPVTDDTLTVVASHSGPMRALVAHAFARDLGEPDNLEAVAIHLEDRARVTFRGQTADIAVPVLDEPDWG